ncbi:MAG: HDIG domain-containing protein [Candidatus Omnitrophica bacterium]|nr:HDIG domain-containing protein [Candidatus Omnitrophota bacterium]
MNILGKKNAFWEKNETISVLLVLLFVIVALSSIFVNPQFYQRTIHEGDVVLKDIYAPYDYTYKWETDEEKTKEAYESAIEQVPYFLKEDEDAKKRIKERVISNFLENDQAEYKDKVLKVLDALLVLGIISEDDQKEVLADAPNGKAVFEGAKFEEGPFTIKDMLVPDGIKKIINQEYKVDFPDAKERAMAVRIIVNAIEPTVFPSKKKTLLERVKAKENTPPVLFTWEIKKNELIVEKGKRLQSKHIAQISQLRSFLRAGRSKIFFLGMVLVFILLIGFSAIYLKLTRSDNILSHKQEVSILLLNMWLMLIIADFVMRLPQPSYFIPLASMGMILVLLVGFSLAFLPVLVMSLLISVLTGGGVDIVLVLLAGSIVGMFAVKEARRRANILWAGLLAGIAKVFAIICVGCINGISFNVLLGEGMWGIASGLVSGILVMGVLPIFEFVFKVPTKISLLEMSDLNHPLLKRLAMEAPGTYHHSIMVGNLAESACDSIHANSLLARVGAYYHDVGKISKPNYYNENEMGNKSKHIGLTPSMSSLIISKHVKEGVELAKKHKVNNKIIDFIQQHHGDSLIFFFYQKALEQSKDESDTVKEENFRYPGPKPQTKETAIVLLADAVEASSRSLDDPTPSSIKNMVRKVVNNKFIDGQLEECDLTLKDMHNITDAFVRVLMGIFHTRNYDNGKKK